MERVVQRPERWQPERSGGDCSIVVQRRNTLVAREAAFETAARRIASAYTERVAGGRSAPSSGAEPNWCSSVGQLSSRQHQLHSTSPQHNPPHTAGSARQTFRTTGNSATTSPTRQQTSTSAIRTRLSSLTPNSGAETLNLSDLPNLLLAAGCAALSMHQRTACKSPLRLRITCPPAATCLHRLHRTRDAPQSSSCSPAALQRRPG